MINRNVPTLCPYIMAFLNAKWTERRLGVPVTIVDKFVVHEAEEVDVEAH